MNASLHFSQINVPQAVACRLAAIEAELAELHQSEPHIVSIAAEELFHLEALGCLVDLTTGFVTLPQARARVRSARNGQDAVTIPLFTS